MYATVIDDGARQTDYLADIVSKITQLPFWWAILSALLLLVAFTFFGLAVLIVVVMVKAIRGAVTVLASRTPAGSTPEDPPT